MEFEDKTLICKECGQEFIFSAGEQQFFAEKGLKNLPARCPDCRKKRKQQEEEEIEKYQITCAQCGKKSLASFEIEPGQTFYCHHCFDIIKRKEEKKPSPPTPDNLKMAS